ncbi:MAG: aldehyde dehydrogenase family protein, partial [Bacteroidia bacterium]
MSKLELSNFIAGEYHPAQSGLTLPLYEPASGEEYGRVPDSDAGDVAQAYQAASQAFEGWSTLAAEQRFILLNRIAEGIDHEREALAQAESRDQGKPHSKPRNQKIRAAQNFRFFATAAMQFASESHAMEDKAINYTLRQPIGVVGCISPWNLPLYLFTWKIAPALAAGNCVVAKPSEFTPVTAWMLGKICQKAGLPAGVLNIVQGLGPSVGQALVEHPGIKAISFTGGTATGKHLAATAAPMFKKLSLELGGKNPNMIFADADLEK